MEPILLAYAMGLLRAVLFKGVLQVVQNYIIIKWLLSIANWFGISGHKLANQLGHSYTRTRVHAYMLIPPPPPTTPTHARAHIWSEILIICAYFL